MQKQKGVSTLVGIIIIIAVAIIVFGGVFTYEYFFKSAYTCWPYCPGMTDQDREDIKKSMLEAETAGWETYTNEEYGFEIKYPGQLKVFENYPISGTATTIVAFQNVPAEIIQDRSSIDNPDRKWVGRKIVLSINAFNGYAEMFQAYSSAGAEESGTMLIDKYQAKKMYRPADPAKGDIDVAVYLISDRNLAIMVPGADMSKISQNDSDLMLSTFKFTPVK